MKKSKKLKIQNAGALRHSLTLSKLAVATLGVMSAISSQGAVNNIGDLEIYEKAQGKKGKAVIVMMLDTSGSMELIDYTVGGKKQTFIAGGRCPTEIGGTVTQEYTVSNDITDKKVNLDGSISYVNVGTISYRIKGCPLPGRSMSIQQTADGYEIVGGHANRFSSLRVGLISLLADASKLEETNQIGVGRYPNAANTVAGSIGIPTAELTLAHRIRLMNYIRDITPKSSTPSANAYAEAGAYMLGTTTSGRASGFNISSADTKTGSVYKSPVTAQDSAQCGADGYGIFFLTDGEPNNSGPATVVSMNSTLSGSGLTITSAPTGGGWNNINEYSRHLRNPANPKKQEIRTATVGFGGEFAGFTTKTIKVPDPATGGLKDKIIPDCGSTGVSSGPRALCRWGEYPSADGSTGGLGNGGFTSTGSAAALANAVTDFIGDLTSNNQISATPAGSITIPDDPYSALSQQPIAYMPMIQPDLVSNASAWKGNLKKYQIENGTFYGRSNVRLYASTTTGSQIQGVTLNPAAVDLWSANVATDNTQVTVGGVYSNLKVPTATNSSHRAVFIEDIVGGNSVLRKFSVNAAGELQLDGAAISASNTFGDTALYTIVNINHLLAFMGFNGIPDDTLMADLGTVKTTPSGANPKLGGVLHGVPSLVSYSATLDNSGAIPEDSVRDEYVLFGSMNGALHLVDTDDFEVGNGGQEKLTIIPKIMLQNQPKALSMTDHTDEGRPVFGVDAPWLVTANHVYDFENKQIKVGDQPDITFFSGGAETTERAVNRLGGLHIFGGFRLGAKGLYGIDLTETSGSNPNGVPKLDFALTSDKADFNRIGHIWQKPTLARIKTNSGDKYGTDVLVFGGGYDMCYEDEAFQIGESTGADATCNAKAAADGNAVYIVNAKTGELIWSASSSYAVTDAKFRKVDTMTNSIVGSIEVLDRNNDGYMDHLYFADLGGQVFRADFTNSGDRLAGGAAESVFRNHRVLRVLHETGEGRYKRRFYEKPVVDFYADNTGGTFGLVMVSSGDRSSPLSKMRTDNDKADRLYSIFDYDLTLPNADIFAATGFTSSVVDSTASNMIRLGDGSIMNADADGTPEQKVIKGIHVDKKRGWYYPLYHFEGYKNALYNKNIGKYEVVRGLMEGTGIERRFLYTTVYNPDMRYTQASACSARVVGGSERQFYCLPYGICENNAPLAGYQRAGMGIQELAFGPLGSGENRTTKVLISSMLADEHSITEYNKTAKDYFEQTIGKDNKVSQSNLTKIDKPEPDAGVGIDENFTLTPKRWYDLSSTTEN